MNTNNNSVTVDTLNALAAERRKLGAAYTFPHKLHDILERNEVDGVFRNIIAWQEHGRCFRIHDQKEFINVIMKMFFNQTKLASFQRQLNLYGFKRLYKGRDRGCYYHELFVKGKPDMCHQIIRTKVNGRKVRQSSKNDEPNFYDSKHHLNTTNILSPRPASSNTLTHNIPPQQRGPGPGPVMQHFPPFHHNYAETAAVAAAARFFPNTARDPLYDERQENMGPNMGYHHSRQPQMGFNPILHEQRIDQWLEMQRMEQQYATLLLEAEKLRRQQEDVNNNGQAITTANSSMLNRMNYLSQGGGGGGGGTSNTSIPPSSSYIGRGGPILEPIPPYTKSENSTPNISG